MIYVPRAGKGMTQADQLAAFVRQASYDDLSEAARQQLKIRVLDALGCAIGALAGEPVRLIREQVEDFAGTGHCTLIGGGRGRRRTGRRSTTAR